MSGIWKDDNVSKTDLEDGKVGLDVNATISNDKEFTAKQNDSMTTNELILEELQKITKLLKKIYR